MIVLPIWCGLTFARPSDPTYGSRKLSDHNRSPISIGHDKIENRERMANGTLRTFVVATKRTLKVSWDDLPRQDSYTADGFWGANSIMSFYSSNGNSPFWVTINYGDGTNNYFQAMFTDFNVKLSKRSLVTDLYNIDFGLEEV
jgi:hypothetical protein